MRGKPVMAATVAIIVAGCGATKTVTQTTTVTQTQTVTRTVVKHEPAPPTKTVTVTDTTTTPAPTAAASGGAGPYQGNGIKNVGTITVGSPSTIQWACQGCATFTLTSGYNGTSAISISSTAGSGTSAVDPGTYNDVQVISNGNWAFRIVSG